MFDDVRQALALDKLHGIVVAALVLALVVDRDDVGVVQLGGCLRLALKPGYGRGRKARSLIEHLHRHSSLQAALPRPIDRAHAAAPDHLT